MLKLLTCAAALTFPTLASAGCPPSQPKCTPRVVFDAPPPTSPLIHSDAAVAALGALDLTSTAAGEVSWSAGVAGVSVDGSTATALAAGLRYGISGDVSVQLKVSASKDAHAAFIGFGGKF